MAEVWKFPITEVKTTFADFDLPTGGTYIREEWDGNQRKKYMLVKASAAIVDKAMCVQSSVDTTNGVYIVTESAADVGTATDDRTGAWGINSLGKAMAANDFFWMQVSGQATGFADTALIVAGDLLGCDESTTSVDGSLSETVTGVKNITALTTQGSAGGDVEILLPNLW